MYITTVPLRQQEVRLSLQNSTLYQRNHPWRGSWCLDSFLLYGTTPSGHETDRGRHRRPSQDTSPLEHWTLVIVAPSPDEREEGEKESRGEKERRGRGRERERSNMPTTHYSDTKFNFYTQNIVPFLLTICLSLSSCLINWYWNILYYITCTFNYL